MKTEAELLEENAKWFAEARAAESEADKRGGQCVPPPCGPVKLAPRHFAYSAAPPPMPTTREGKIRRKMEIAIASFAAGKMTTNEFARTDLLLRDALAELEIGVPGVTINGEELTGPELYLWMDDLKRSLIAA